MAPTLGVDIVQVVVRDADEIEPAIDAFVHEAGGGLIVFPTPVLSTRKGPKREYSSATFRLRPLAVNHARPIHLPSERALVPNIRSRALIRRSASQLTSLSKSPS